MTVSLIWAQSTSGVIGRAGGIPWRLPEDQENFKELTAGRTVVMGRRTWESLPASVRPLPGRRNVVVTRRPDYVADGAEVAGSLDEALSDSQVWVIGGADIYALALPSASRCEVTEVDVDLRPDDADVLAPVLDKTWIGTTGEWLTSNTGLRYRFCSYRRNARPPRSIFKSKAAPGPVTADRVAAVGVVLSHPPSSSPWHSASAAATTSSATSLDPTPSHAGSEATNTQLRALAIALLTRGGPHPVLPGRAA